MTARELIAYGLLAAMALAFACWIVWLRYNSRERTLWRQRHRDEARYRDRFERKVSGQGTRRQPQHAF